MSHVWPQAPWIWNGARWEWLEYQINLRAQMAKDEIWLAAHKARLELHRACNAAVLDISRARNAGRVTRIIPTGAHRWNK